jgi:hypothetical protein
VVELKSGSEVTLDSIRHAHAVLRWLEHTGSELELDLEKVGDGFLRLCQEGWSNQRVSIVSPRSSRQYPDSL